MRLALAQMQMQESMADNLEASIAYLRQADAAEADLVLFPEAQLTPFFPAWRKDESPYCGKLDEMCPDLGSPALGQLLGTCRSLGIAASFNLWCRWPDGHAYDTSITAGPDGTLLGEPARMVHVANYPGFFEADYYTPSPSGFQVYDTPWGRIGVVICYDRHFPESIRSCAAQGAALVLVPTVNVEGEPLELFEWEMRVQAFQNTCYVALCNRSGKEPNDGPVFAGESLVAAPDGTLVGKAGAEESLFVADIDLGRVAKIRRERTWLDERRPDLYR